MRAFFRYQINLLGVNILNAENPMFVYFCQGIIVLKSTCFHSVGFLVCEVFFKNGQNVLRQSFCVWNSYVSKIRQLRSNYCFRYYDNCWSTLNIHDVPLKSSMLFGAIHKVRNANFATFDTYPPCHSLSQISSRIGTKRF